MPRHLRSRPAPYPLPLPALLGVAVLACRAPAGDGALANLAPLFEEPLHGFTPLAPQMVGENDRSTDAAFDRAGRLVLQAGGEYVSQPLRWERPFDELLLSWNVSVPPGAGLAVEVRLESHARGERTPWLWLGGPGRNGRMAPGARTVEFDGGRVAVDVVRCERPYDGFRYRLRAHGGEVIVHALAACLTDTTRLATLDAGPIDPAWGGPPRAVPARSQRSVPAELAPRICSPTSVAMVLAHHGVDVSLTELAAEIHDADHDIYGNWPRAVQAAFEHGVPGALVRLSSWRAVQHFLALDVPLVVSVKAEEGELRGAPYPRTSGHLLVVTGFAAEGGVHVNDPAAARPEDVARIYRAEDLERCWLRRGGVAYAIGPPR